MARSRKVAVISTFFHWSGCSPGSGSNSTRLQEGGLCSWYDIQPNAYLGLIHVQQLEIGPLNLEIHWLNHVWQTSQGNIRNFRSEGKYWSVRLYTHWRMMTVYAMHISCFEMQRIFIPDNTLRSEQARLRNLQGCGIDYIAILYFWCPNRGVPRIVHEINLDIQYSTKSYWHPLRWSAYHGSRRVLNDAFILRSTNSHAESVKNDKTNILVNPTTRWAWILHAQLRPIADKTSHYSGSMHCHCCERYVSIIRF